MSARTTVNRLYDPDELDYAVAAAAAAIAADYRDQYPLLRPISLLEQSQIVRNTEQLSIYHIDTTLPLSCQRIVLKIKLAILGYEAFLAASERLGASQELRRFVRHDKLPKLNTAGLFAGQAPMTSLPNPP